ncbi:hypothetical protein [Anaerospora hongkongensis]|uniref:hypothetical protein n=1 Tax=Anaerospora hongkongensis TaxID=244830 RepID=UPI00289B4771|nr:hypothetical protein [Anaerospora hongkongensis]
MKTVKQVIAILLFFCLSLPVVTASARDFTEERKNAREKINETEWVTYQQLAENEEHYKDKIVNFTATCRYFDGKAMALLGEKGELFSVQIRTYRFKPDVEYTVVGRFLGMMPAKGEPPWAIFIETTHLPYFEEYGL